MYNKKRNKIQIKFICIDYVMLIWCCAVVIECIQASNDKMNDYKKKKKRKSTYQFIGILVLFSIFSHIFVPVLFFFSFLLVRSEKKNYFIHYYIEQFDSMPMNGVAIAKKHWRTRNHNIIKNGGLAAFYGKEKFPSTM